MADKRQKRVAEFIEPFRVKPGSKVSPPAFRSAVQGPCEEEEGRVALLAEGVRLLSEYQARLAAQDTWGCRSRLDRQADRQQVQWSSVGAGARTS